jgi:DNA-directed RNA polymerase specialized sigma24 family protein
MAAHNLGGKLLPFRSRRAVELASDDALLADVAVGETGPLCELFYRYGDRVRRVIAQTGALDAFTLDQAVLRSFLQVYRSAARFSGDAKVSSWIVAVALEAARAFSHAAPPREVTGTDPGAVRCGQGPRRAPRVPVIAALPLSWRLALLLVDGEGVKIPDVAVALGCTERIVWKRLDKAHRRLQTAPANGPRHQSLNRVRRFLRTGRLCPARWKLTRAVCNDVDPRMGWHLSGCSDCEREYVSLLSLTARLSMLSGGGMTDASRDRVAAVLLAANRPPPVNAT